MVVQCEKLKYLSENRTVLESKKHNEERAKVAVVSKMFPGAMFIGSSGIQALLRDRNDWVIANQIDTTKDADIVMRSGSLNVIASSMGATQSEISLIETRRISFGSLGITDKTVEVPFKLVRLSSEYVPAQQVFDNVDIFTPKTGVGPIPVTEEVFGSATAVKFNEISVQVAPMFFLFASQANPLALTEKRLNRLSFVLFQFYGENGRESYEKEMKKSVDYISLGSENVARELDANPSLRSVKELKDMTDYDGRVRKIPDRILQKKKYFERSAALVGLDSADAKAVVEIVSDLLSAFRKGTPSVQEVHEVPNIATV
jgi:hypothetical protein